tara:strand:- start:245 stop:520 length:276 start_codon:yes stop_codon:yes gene_type:complete
MENQEMITVRAEFSIPKWAADQHWPDQSIANQKRKARAFVIDQAIEPQIASLTGEAERRVSAAKLTARYEATASFVLNRAKGLSAALQSLQ